MAKMKLRTAGYPTANPRQNRITPIITANTVNLIMNLLIYFFNGASSDLAFAAKLAI